MPKTPQKVTKDCSRQKRGKKLHETDMKRLKEDILRDNQLSISSSAPSTSYSTDNSTLPTSSSTNKSTYSTSSSTIYGIGMDAVIVMLAYVFFA